MSHPRGNSSTKTTYLFLYGSQAVALVCGLVVFRLSARFFGAEGLADYSLVRRAQSLLQVPIILSLSVSIPRFVSFESEKKSGREVTYYAAGMLNAFILIALVAFVSLLFQGPLSNLFFGSSGAERLIAPLVTMLAGSSLVVVTYGYLRGLLQIGLASCVWALGNGLALPLSFFAFPHSLPQAMYGLGVAQGAIALAHWFWTLSRKAGGTFGHDLIATCRELASFGVVRVPGELSWLGLFSLPAFLSVHYVSIQNGGAVAFGLSMLNLYIAALSPVSFLLLPRASRLIAASRFDELRKAISSVIRLSMAGALVVTTILEIFLEKLIVLYLGPEYRPFAATLRPLLFSGIPLTYYVTVRSAIDAYHLKPRNAINLAAAMITFILLAWAFQLRLVSFVPFEDRFSWALFVAFALLGSLTALELRTMIKEIRA